MSELNAHRSTGARPKGVHVLSTQDRSQASTCRVSRAVEALRFTARHNPHPWLRKLALMKYWEAAAAQKLAMCGYRVRFDRTDPRSIW